MVTNKAIVNILIIYKSLIQWMMRTSLKTVIKSQYHSKIIKSEKDQQYKNELYNLQT